MTTKQKERALSYVLEKRGYLVQAFTGEMSIGAVLPSLNLSPSARYRKQPFRVIAETTREDYWEQNLIAADLKQMGIPLKPGELARTLAGLSGAVWRQ